MTQAKFAPIENIERVFDELRWAEIVKAMKLAADRYDSSLPELTERQLFEVFIDACGLVLEDIQHEITTYTTLGHDRETAVHIAIHVALLKKLRKPQ